ncbi:MAG: type II toxin-antitoxin system YafQ family toxin [Clostridia bacterium]|nr:type II toxin-antitoxin system YafQ family toxin [Clostridia bacterium]
MLKVVYTSRFKKDYKALLKRGVNVESLNKTILLISEEKQLPAINNDHPLKGSFTGCRECHLGFDWLLVYKIHKDILVLELIRTGTHQDVFRD